jgi:hypothetical protein
MLADLSVGSAGECGGAYFFKKPENFFWNRDSLPPRSIRCC